MLAPSFRTTALTPATVEQARPPGQNKGPHSACAAWIFLQPRRGDMDNRYKTGGRATL